MIEEISDDSADYGRWTKSGVKRKVAILLLQWLSKLQDSYSFGRPLCAEVGPRYVTELDVFLNRPKLCFLLYYFADLTISVNSLSN